MSLLAMNSLYKKGRGRVPLIQRINVNAMCYKDYYFPKREFKINYLIVCFTWCALFFQCVCFLLQYVCRASYVKTYVMR